MARVGISHSIHLHGHAFQVMDMGTREEYENGNSTFVNATHLPVIKDTVTMGWRHFVTIRFRATNPGYWLFHCHLEYHHKACIYFIFFKCLIILKLFLIFLILLMVLQVGMVLILKVGNHTDIAPPPIDFPKCGSVLAPVSEIF